MQLDRQRTILRDELLKEEIHGAVIDGIKVFVLPKKGFRRKYAEISFEYGSNDNTFIPNGSGEPVNVPAGITHFLEHKMFEKPWGKSFFCVCRPGGISQCIYGKQLHFLSFLDPGELPQSFRPPDGGCVLAVFHRRVSGKRKTDNNPRDQDVPGPAWLQAA